jgi:4-hydroxybutyrate CoA-transferase
MADFVLGARLAWGGKSILATPASTNAGAVSKIVCELGPGTPVSVPRHDVDRVATEFGMVQLRGKSLDERAAALISIADPAFRDRLSKQWQLRRKQM